MRTIMFWLKSFFSFLSPKKKTPITKGQIDALLLMVSMRDQAAAALVGKSPGTRSYIPAQELHIAHDKNVQAAVQALWGCGYVAPEDLRVKVSGELLKLVAGGK